MAMAGGVTLAIFCNPSMTEHPFDLVRDLPRVLQNA
jgi:hypothetical protein